VHSTIAAAGEDCFATFGNCLSRLFGSVSSAAGGRHRNFNAGISQNFTGPGVLKGLTIRADVLNLFDNVYQIRSGSGVGVGAPQWGQRRGFFIGISKKFG